MRIGRRYAHFAYPDNFAMVTVATRAQRILESKRKIESPFELDESLCLFSPQDNVDALRHQRIADWLRYIRHDYTPDLPRSQRRVLLLMPCTKTKPYPFSSEHKHINQRLIAAGFCPVGREALPAELRERLEDDFTGDVLNLTPLVNNSGTTIHRMVISEPMALVPYECIVEYEGKPSPSTAYDDPGLFENRGNAVSPWRPDSTAISVSPTRWRWGDEERRQYVVMHNVMAETIAATIGRIAGHYTEIVSWVAPGLTHRSFILSRDERAAHNVRSSMRVGTTRPELFGANDHLPPAQRIECLPTPRQCADAVVCLARRLGTNIRQAQAVYSRGGTNATPLALPELLDVLVDRLSGDRQPALLATTRPAPSVASLFTKQR
jgi:hypothetical protein